MSEFESHEVEIEVDLAAFLPEGTEFDAAAELDAEPVEAAEPVEEVGAAESAESAEDAVDEPGSSVDLEALDQLERDLDAVDAAIAALDAGTYGLDPATGAPIDDALLAQDPTRLS